MSFPGDSYSDKIFILNSYLIYKIKLLQN